jgi:hypothetical protein
MVVVWLYNVVVVVHRNSIGTLEAVEGEGLPAFRALLGNAPFRF